MHNVNFSIHFSMQVEGEPSKISENDRVLIKTNIVELMLKSPESIQRQLSDAISIIGREDFPDKWKDLLGVSILVNFLVHFSVVSLRGLFNLLSLFHNYYYRIPHNQCIC